MTATVLENIATRIERLVLNGEDPEIILDELKLILISVNSGTSLPRLDFLFSAFAVQDEDVVNTLCSIIETVFSKLSLSETLVYPEILLGLNSTITRLQILAIKAILNPLQNKRFDQDSVLRLANDPIFDALLSCLGSIDTGVSENSTRTILKLASFKDVLEALLSTKKLTILEDIKAISPTCNLRVLDLMVSICTRQEITKIVVESGLLDDLVNGLKSSDLVAVLNRIEILSRISESSIGIEFLTSVGTFELFNSEMKNSDDLDLDVMLKKCSILKFYSNLAITNFTGFEIANKGNMIINGVAAMLESTNTEVKENAILFLGNLGSTDNGLGVILNSNVLDLFLDVFNGSAGNSRLLSLQALSLILNVSNPKTESIFYRIYGNKLDSLVQYSKSAFDEFRVASYAILKSLTLHEWGCLLLSKREVAEFLVDRNSDSSKIGCEWKFSIIQSIVSGGYLNAFDQETQKAFERYLKAGVFFREVGTEVEYEAI